MLVKKRKSEYGNLSLPRKKSSKQMERHLKGVSNHRRIEILFLIADNKGISVDDISGRLHCNLKTISSHIWRLSQAGLVRKNYQGRTVIHELSPYGKTFHKFLAAFQCSV